MLAFSPGLFFWSLTNSAPSENFFKDVAQAQPSKDRQQAVHRQNVSYLRVRRRAGHKVVQHGRQNERRREEVSPHGQPQTESYERQKEITHDTLNPSEHVDEQSDDPALPFRRQTFPACDVDTRAAVVRQRLARNFQHSPHPMQHHSQIPERMRLDNHQRFARALSVAPDAVRPERFDCETRWITQFDAFTFEHLIVTVHKPVASAKLSLAESFPQIDSDSSARRREVREDKIVANHDWRDDQRHAEHNCRAHRNSATPTRTHEKEQSDSPTNRQIQWIDAQPARHA